MLAGSPQYIFEASVASSSHLASLRWDGGRNTYSDNSAEFHQARKFLALGATAPELPGYFVRGHIDCAEGELVGFENCLQACRCGDDVGRPRSQGGVEIKGGIGHVDVQGKIIRS